jgi:hypothetical protein
LVIKSSTIDLSDSILKFDSLFNVESFPEIFVDIVKECFGRPYFMKVLPIISSRVFQQQNIDEAVHLEVVKLYHRMLTGQVGEVTEEVFNVFIKLLEEEGTSKYVLNYF